MIVNKTPLLLYLIWDQTSNKKFRCFKAFQEFVISIRRDPEEAKTAWNEWQNQKDFFIMNDRLFQKIT